MTLTLELPRELEKQLSQEAAEMGMPLSEYALYLLTLHYPTVSLQTGAELVRYWRDEDLIGSRTDIADSQVYARQLRQQAETRQRS